MCVTGICKYDPACTGKMTPSELCLTTVNVPTPAAVRRTSVRGAGWRFQSQLCRDAGKIRTAESLSEGGAEAAAGLRRSAGANGHHEMPIEYVSFIHPSAGGANTTEPPRLENTQLLQLKAGF